MEMNRWEHIMGKGSLVNMVHTKRMHSGKCEKEIDQRRQTLPKQRRRKWDDKAVEGVLIRYDDATKGYWILDPKTNRTWVSCCVKIVEKAGLEKCIAAPEPEGELEREIMTSQPKEGVLANLDRPEEEKLPAAASNQVSDVEEDWNLSEDEGLILPATKTRIITLVCAGRRPARTSV
ncbi:hypothetical protein M513_12733 [Trichuris suis]|uniref:Retroviral polymerase SH3-like domain-containing protein n=1 Tax=Trichuris suis TaxID=68888 RepID=A0A085LN52_9BILA|nr:hypothetical protein M513_12733 [Trichuris suis]